MGRFHDGVYTSKLTRNPLGATARMRMRMQKNRKGKKKE
jgi:hypothetical protein